MTDRELLELAARAAGLEKDDSPYNGGGSGNEGFDSMGNMVLDWHNNERWNPLTNDGDALRLAVKLGFELNTSWDEHATAMWGSSEIKSCSEDHKGDPYAATRRAIVRAAAETGKGMK